MSNQGLITMSMREVDRLKTIQAVADGNLKATTASVRLGLSRCQVDRLADRYQLPGFWADIGLREATRAAWHCVKRA